MSAACCRAPSMMWLAGCPGGERYRTRVFCCTDDWRTYPRDRRVPPRLLLGLEDEDDDHDERDEEDTCAARTG